MLAVGNWQGGACDVACVHDDQIRRRRPRPGVTAAATTAVLATGDGPGLTALATTAVFATGWPMTPTRPTRAALSGISFSLTCSQGCVVGLDRGDDRLDRDSSIGNELAACAARSRCKWSRPEVLPDQHAGDAAGLHGRRKVRDVVLREQLRQLCLDGLQVTQLIDVGELGRIDRPVLVLLQDQDVDQADRSGVDELQQLLGHLACEVALAGRELDYEVVDRA